MSQYISDIVNNWSDRKVQKNTLILTEIYPLKGEESVDLPDFKKDKTIRLSIVKVSLRLLAFFGYKIRDRYSLEQIKPIFREEKGVVVGLCNKKNIQLITRVLKFFGENNMGILSGIFCLAICKALQDCSNFKQIVWDNKVLREWLKTQKYLTEGNISKLHTKYFNAMDDKGDKSKSNPVTAPKAAASKPPVIERTYSQSSASSDGEGPRVKKPRENVLASLYEKGGRYEGQKERMKILDEMFPASSEEEDEIPDPVPPKKPIRLEKSAASKPPVIERTYSQSSASSDGEGPRVKKPRENVLASLYEKGGRYEGQKERMKILDEMFPASSEEEDEIPDPVPPVKKNEFLKM